MTQIELRYRMVYERSTARYHIYSERDNRCRDLYVGTEQFNGGKPPMFLTVTIESHPA